MTPPDRKCPRCGLWNSGAALTCDCGYEFETRQIIDRSGNRDKRAKRISYFLREWSIGIVLIIIVLAGFIGLVIYFVSRIQWNFVW